MQIIIYKKVDSATLEGIMHELYTGRYVPTEYDASWRDPYFERIFEEAGGDEQARRIVDAFKVFYRMFTDDLVKWYANLYDPYIGGYYCTTSGKELEGHLPDIESSKMAMNFIDGSGLSAHAGRDWRNVIPEEMKEKFVRFAKRMQEPNGYFYNIMKKQEEIDAFVPKRGRDLSWCTWFLEELGAKPTYDSPMGMKGDGIDWQGNPVSDYKPSVSESGEEVNAAAVHYADYLENKETFLAYLNEKIDIKGRSYPAGNELNATFQQIKKRDIALKEQGADFSLCDTLIEWLNERIDPFTGYWAPTQNFAGTNGFFKVITIYNAWGYPYPEIEKAVDSVIAGILGDEVSLSNSCTVYNLWIALIECKRHVKMCQPEEIRNKVLESIDKKLKAHAPEAILNTFKKQSGYQKPDGAFAHFVNCDEDINKIKTHQGNIPTGRYIHEGDVDAISRGSYGTLNAMFDAFGFTRVPIYHEREWNIYLEILKNAKPVIKKETPTYR